MLRSTKMLFTVATAVAFFHSGHAFASFLNASSTGLASPAATQDFSSPVLACNSSVTNQFAYVSFSPNVYLCPQSGSSFGISGNDIGNFTFPTEPAYVNPLTMTFSSTQNSVAFLMAGDITPYTFEALLNGVVVDSGSGTATGSAAYFGFAGDTFNQIVISQSATGGGPYWLIANVELSSTSSVPEPSALILFGAGVALLGSMVWLRRRRMNRLEPRP